jgi:hypothetical protein
MSVTIVTITIFWLIKKQYLTFKFFCIIANKPNNRFKEQKENKKSKFLLNLE